MNMLVLSNKLHIRTTKLLSKHIYSPQLQTSTNQVKVQLVRFIIIIQSQILKKLPIPYTLKTLSPKP